MKSSITFRPPTIVQACAYREKPVSPSTVECEEVSRMLPLPMK